MNGAIRLAAAMIVGSVLTYLYQTFGLELESEPLVQAITVLLSVGYYVIVRIIASKFPFAEWFLVIPKSPIYVSPENVSAAREKVSSYQ